MPRNEAKPLSEIEARYQRKVMSMLLPIDYREVTLSYTKRDGSASQSTGMIRFFNGGVGMDTGSVTLETKDKGMRTINLHRITHVE